MIYMNLGGNSGVVSFEFDDNSIQVQFADGPLYLYTYSSAGRENIEKMKSPCLDRNQKFKMLKKKV